MFKLVLVQTLSRQVMNRGRLKLPLIVKIEVQWVTEKQENWI